MKEVAKKIYKQGTEIKKEIDIGIIVEKPAWFSYIESIYPETEKVYFPDDQDEMVCIKRGGITIGFVAGKGSSIAACMIERMRVYGAKTIIRIGTCGSLSKSLKLWSPIITTACFSSEGTSGHYLPKGYPIISDPRLNNVLIEKFTENDIEYFQGVTLTTRGRLVEHQ